MKNWIPFAALAALGIALMRKTTSGVYSSASVQRVARAIAVAEGYMKQDGTILSGNRSAKANNPGSIMTAEWKLIEYPTPDAGWQALYRQVDLMLSGKSRYYNPSMTISEVARIYTGEASYMNWARNVATVLGVTPDTPIGGVA